MRISLLAASFLVTRAAGQDVGAPADVLRVRIRVPHIQARPIVGQIEHVGDTGLHVRRSRGASGGERVVWIEWDAIESIERSLGTRSRRMLGLLVGVPTGMVAAAAWWSAIKEADDDALVNGYALAAGAAGGGLLGFAAGSLARTEVWQGVRLVELRGAATSVGVGLSLSLPP